MTDYDSFSSIPNYNKFRFTADTVDRDDLIALAVKMPRDFRFWFIGAFSTMLDIDAWQSANGVTAETMTEIANEDVVFAEFCEFVADCVLNSADVQNAIQNVVNNGGAANTVINNTVYSNTVLIAENADGNGCNDNARYGRIQALIDYIDTVQLDFFESIDAATNLVGEIENLVSAIPIFETLPFDEAINIIASTGEQWQDSYTASVNTQLKEDFACELWCEISDCDVTLVDIRTAIEKRYNIDSTQGLLNVLSLTALFARIASTVASAGGLTYIGDDFVYLSWLLQIAAVEASGEFFGVSIGDYVAQAANGAPSGLWSNCTPCPNTWFYGVDWQVTDDGAFKLVQNPPSQLWTYTPFSGVDGNTPGNLDRCFVRLNFDGVGTLENVTVNCSVSLPANSVFAVQLWNDQGVFQTQVTATTGSSFTASGLGWAYQNGWYVTFGFERGGSATQPIGTMIGYEIDGSGDNPYA